MGERARGWRIEEIGVARVFEAWLGNVFPDSHLDSTGDADVHSRRGRGYGERELDADFSMRLALYVAPCVGIGSQRVSHWGFAVVGTDVDVC